MQLWAALHTLGSPFLLEALNLPTSCFSRSSSTRPSLIHESLDRRTPSRLCFPWSTRAVAFCDAFMTLSFKPDFPSWMILPSQEIQKEAEFCWWSSWLGTTHHLMKKPSQRLLLVWVFHLREIRQFHSNFFWRKSSSPNCLGHVLGIPAHLLRVIKILHK